MARPAPAAERHGGGGAHLGAGLRCLRYRRGDGSAVNGYLDYAWRSERYETDLRLFTFSWGLDRLQLAIPDIDTLARAIKIIPAENDS